MLIRYSAEMHVFVVYSCPFPFELDVVSLVKQFCGVGLPHCALAVALMLPTHAERVLAVEVCGEGRGGGEGWLCVCIYVCVCVCVGGGEGRKSCLVVCVCVCVWGGGGREGVESCLVVCVWCVCIIGSAWSTGLSEARGSHGRTL